jgi:hypothetical protein
MVSTVNNTTFPDFEKMNHEQKIAFSNECVRDYFNTKPKGYSETEIPSLIELFEKRTTDKKLALDRISFGDSMKTELKNTVHNYFVCSRGKTFKSKIYYYYPIKKFVERENTYPLIEYAEDGPFNACVFNSFTVDEIRETEIGEKYNSCEKLTIRNFKGTKFDFGPFGKLKSIKKISIYNCYFLLELIGIEKMENVEEIIINDIMDCDLSPLSKMKNLKKIKIMDSYIQNVDGMVDGKVLHELYITSCPLLEQVSGLAKSKFMNRLVFSHCSSLKLNGLENAPMKLLCFAYCHIKSVDNFFGGTCEETLEELSGYGNKLEEVTAFRNYTRLRKIEFYQNPIKICNFGGSYNINELRLDTFDNNLEKVIVGDAKHIYLGGKNKKLKSVIYADCTVKFLPIDFVESLDRKLVNYCENEEEREVKITRDEYKIRSLRNKDKMCMNSTIRNTVFIGF